MYALETLKSHLKFRQERRDDALHRAAALESQLKEELAMAATCNGHITNLEAAIMKLSVDAD